MLLCLTVINPKESIHLGFHLTDAIHHFLHHLEQHHSNPALYVVEHGSGARHHHHENGEHEDMPANHQHITDNFYPLTTLTEKIRLELELPFSEQKQKEPAVSQQFFSTAFVHTIWQPPRHTNTI